jgi:hypothetical protein
MGVARAYFSSVDNQITCLQTYVMSFTTILSVDLDYPGKKNNI